MSKYKEGIAEQLIEHMEGGLSIESFAGVIGVNRTTLHRWKDKYPEFKEAYEIGYCKSLLFWEKMGRAGATGKLPGFNTGAWIFNLKNRFGWRDRTEITTDEKGISINIDKDDAKL